MNTRNQIQTSTVQEVVVAAQHATSNDEHVDMTLDTMLVTPPKVKRAKPHPLYTDEQRKLIYNLYTSHNLTPKQIRNTLAWTDLKRNYVFDLVRQVNKGTSLVKKKRKGKKPRITIEDETIICEQTKHATWTSRSDRH